MSLLWVCAAIAALTSHCLLFSQILFVFLLIFFTSNPTQSPFPLHSFSITISRKINSYSRLQGLARLGMDETVKDLAAKTPTTSSSSSSTSRAPPKPQLLDLFDITPVADGLCSVLSIAEIINLTRTCKRLSTLDKNLILSQWNVNRLLGRFVDKPREFRSQMAECDAVVSGSQALQFFERVHWKEADLDVFIRMGSGVDKFCEYLMETEGYKHVSTRTDDGKVDYDTLDLVLVIALAFRA
jgi:hypothetical protein